MPVFLAAATLFAAVSLTIPPARASGGSPPNDQAVAAASTPPSAAAEIETVIETQGLSAARVRMQEIDAHPDRYAVGERDINALGYRYLARKAFPEALAVFEFNVRRFPASNNAYDSLAEAAAAAGDEARFETTVKTWKAKSPGDASVEGRANALRGLMERATDERRLACVPGQPTGVQGPYVGQAPPGPTPTLFAPGIVSLAFSTEASGSLSPDGREFYFAAAGRNPGATIAPPAGRARFGGPDTVMVSRLGPGGWTFPEPVPVIAGYAAREPHVSPSTGTVFWEWLRAVPPGEADPQNLGTGIWSSERTPSGWSEPRFVGQGMALTSSRDGEYFVTDVSDLSKGDGYLARARVNNGRFTSLERLQAGPERLRSEKVRNLAHPVIAPDGSYLIFDTGGPPARLCFRGEDGTWGEPIDLSAHGLSPRATVSSVSPDGKYLFLNMGGDIYWVSSQLVQALKRSPSALRAEIEDANRVGDAAKAVVAAEQLVSLTEREHVEALYEAARAHARLGHREPAYLLLARAVGAGFDDRQRLLEDEAFTAFRGEDLFRTMARRAWARGYTNLLERANREQVQKSPEIMKALAFKPGERVADIGAGTGYFTFQVADAVGPAGRVTALDIAPEMLEYLDMRIKARRAENVTTRRVASDDPLLTPRSVDTILMVDAIHYVKDRSAYAKRLAAGLAAGGRLVVIDYKPKPMSERPWGPPPEQQFPKEQLDKEVSAAGFVPVASFDFLPEQFFVVYKLRSDGGS